MVDGDTQSDAKSLWSAVGADRAKMQHKIIAHVGRRPDSDPASQQSGGSGIRAVNKRRIPSKLTASLTVPDTDADDADNSVAAFAAAATPTATVVTTDKATTQSAVPIVVSSAPVAVVTTPTSAASHAADVQTPAPFATPKSSISDDSADIKQLRAQLSQVAQERDKLVAQLAAMQRSLTAATAASTSTSSATSSKSSSSSSTIANPAPDQGVANYMYLIALLFVVFAFLFGRFSVATNSVFWFGGNNNSTSQ
jgi:ABC-type Na+ efflux pump permease subunit